MITHKVASQWLDEASSTNKQMSICVVYCCIVYPFGCKHGAFQSETWGDTRKFYSDRPIKLKKVNEELFEHIKLGCSEIWLKQCDGLSKIVLKMEQWSS